MTLALLAGLIAAALAGALGHELAHWTVWRVGGRDPTLDWWRLEVRPRAGRRVTTVVDRVAAAAPYLVGVSVALGGVVGGSPLAVAFGAAMVQIPSRVDVRTMCGETEWEV